MKHKLVKTGKYVKGDKTYNITTDDLNHWRDTFDKWKESGKEVYVTDGHTNSALKSVGRITAVDVEGDSLVGEFELEKEVKFSSVSIESPENYVDGKGVEWKRPLTCVALTLRPVVDDLGTFYFAQDNIIEKVSKYIFGTTETTLTPTEKNISTPDISFDSNSEETKMNDKLFSLAAKSIESKIDSLANVTPAGKQLLKEKLTAKAAIEFSLTDGNDNDWIFDLLSHVISEKKTEMPAQSQELAKTNTDSELSQAIAKLLNGAK